MNHLLRHVAKDLCYRPLLHLVSQRLHIESVDSVAESVSSWLRTQVAYRIAFKGPEQKYIGFAVVKYGILDLTFSVERTDRSRRDLHGVALLKELGFALHARNLPDGAADERDPTCLTELREDIDKNEMVLRLFLEKRPGGLGDPEYFKQQVVSGRLREILRANEAGEDAFERVVRDCFPGDFTVSDACLTNAEFVWFHKHSYL
jgi:hypothetical protein